MFPHDFGIEGEMNDGLYEFQGGPPAPGETAEALLWLLAPERNAGRLHPGFEYGVWERTKIAEGAVLEVLNPNLASSSGRSPVS